jgi:hypothetical protein
MVVGVMSLAVLALYTWNSRLLDQGDEKCTYTRIEKGKLACLLLSGRDALRGTDGYPAVHPIRDDISAPLLTDNILRPWSLKELSHEAETGYFQGRLFFFYSSIETQEFEGK